MVYATNAESQKTGLNTPTYLLDATGNWTLCLTAQAQSNDMA